MSINYSKSIRVLRNRIYMHSVHKAGGWSRGGWDTCRRHVTVLALSTVIQTISEQRSAEGAHYRERLKNWFLSCFIIKPIAAVLYLSFLFVIEFVKWLLSYGKSRCVSKM